MRRITWAMLVWSVLWVASVWAIDPAATVGGKPPSWVLFESWAVGFVLLGAVWAGLIAVGDSWRARVDLRALRSPRGAVLVWTVLWMVLFPIWALDPRATDIGSGPGPYTPVSLKPSEPVLYTLWALGLLVLAVLWFVARARSSGNREMSPER